MYLIDGLGKALPLLAAQLGHRLGDEEGKVALLDGSRLVGAEEEDVEGPEEDDEGVEVVLEAG